MNDNIPFGFIAEEEGGWIKTCIVQNGEIEILDDYGRKWEPLENIRGHLFKTQSFWEDVAECVERNKDAGIQYKLIRNDFHCASICFRKLIEELVCRDILEEEIILLMDQRVYRRAAYDFALTYRDIGIHHEAMMAQQALLFDGAYIRVGFSKFFPTFQINYDHEVKIMIVAITSGQVQVDLPSWCRSGRYDIHLK